MSNDIRSTYPYRDYPVPMQKDEEERRGLGLRLKAARESKDLTQQDVARELEMTTYKTVSAWETGRGLPDALTMKRLAKLYGVSAESLLWDNAPSLEAMQIAAQFDSLTVKQRETFRAVWMAFVESAVGDDEVERKMPVTKMATEKH